MCGIAGIIASEGAAAVSRQALVRMRDAMARRGPDGEGLWVAPEGRVGLAHRRLAIIDLSEAAAQPMATPDGAVRIVFNGEVYNHRQLRRALESEGCRFRTASDTEVLLHLYVTYGEEMASRLRGMYAFAVWDGRDRSLSLFRDPFGIKPLYYSDGGGTFRFASQVKALLAGGGVDRREEPAGHAGFFLWGSVPEPYTLFRGIRALPPGSCLRRDENGRTTLSTFTHPEEEPEDPREAEERLRETLRDSVRCHLVSDVPVGLFLSSGIDSGVLAFLASELLEEPLHTVTLGFREFTGTSADETALAREVSKRCGTEHHEAWIERGDFEEVLADFRRAMDQPSIDGLNTFLVSRVARSAGMKVALSGLGGDELFGGYPSFRDVPRMARWLLSLPALGRSLRSLSAPLLRRFTSTKFAGLLEYGGSWGGAYLLRRGLFMPWELPEVMDADMAREGWEELRTLSRLEETAAPFPTDCLKVAALETAWYMRNQLLRDADWAGMHHSLEIRVPFVDAALFRQVRSWGRRGDLPAKRRVAAVVSPSLPAEVLNRKKTGFSVPVRQWALESEGEDERERGLRGWARRVYRWYASES